MTPIKRKDGKGIIKSRYLKIKVNGRLVDAHRYIMEQHLGRKLERWEEVHHKNEDTHDNRIDNLEVKTKSEHFRHHRPSFRPRIYTELDRYVISQRHSGSNSPCARFTDEQVRQIRHRLKSGETCRALAREFSVGPSTISDIKRNKSYRDRPLIQGNTF